MTVIDRINSSFTDLQTYMGTDRIAIEEGLDRAGAQKTRTQKEEFKTLEDIRELHRSAHAMLFLQQPTTITLKDQTDAAAVVDFYLTRTEQHFQQLLKKNAMPDEIAKLNASRLALKEWVKSAKALLATEESALEATPPSLDFPSIIGGPNPATQEIQITNTGYDRITWQATAATTSGGNWLIVSPTVGVLEGATESESDDSTSVTVAALLLQGLSAQQSPWEGTVTICELDVDGQPIPDSNIDIPVNFNVRTLAISPSTLSFNCAVNGVSPTPQTVTINVVGSGGDTLNWTATSTVPWLTTTQNNGSVSLSTPAQVSIGVIPQNLGVGTYSGAVLLTPAYGNSNGTPQIIEVTLVVQQQCSLQVPQPSYLTFSVEAGTNINPPAQQFTIDTAGVCTDQITVTASGTDPKNTWLQVTQLQGGVGSANFAVSVSPGSLAPGLYTDQIAISATDAGGTSLVESPQYIEVSLTVNAPPELVVSPSSGLTFKDSTGKSHQPITISNAGGEPMNWTASLDKHAPGFVSLSAAQGSGITIQGGTAKGTTTAGGQSNIYVNVNATGITDNETHHTNVTITATDATTGQPVSGSQFTVPITIQIASYGLFLCVLELFNPQDSHRKDAVVVRQTEKLFKRERMTLSDRQLDQLTRSWDRVIEFVSNPTRFAHLGTATCLTNSRIVDLFTVHSLLDQLYDRIESDVTRSTEDIFDLE